MIRAFIFPGQGSQAVGMGKELADSSPVARAVFEEVDDALGQNLSHLMFEGEIDRLTLTENAQPALMSVSVAALRLLLDRSGRTLPELAKYVAGHSLGEYSALAATGAISVTDAARLLRRRGQAMQKAVPVGVGAMAALMGLELDAVQEVAAEAARAGVCAAANDNAPGQVVVSGHRAAVEGAVALAVERGAKRSVMLPVSAPFHCPLMSPAAEAMRDALDRIEIWEPIVPVVANVTARPVRDPAEIRRLLVEQVTGAVRWRESVLYMRDQGIGELVEIGAGKVLSGLARRIDRHLKALSINTPDDMDVFLRKLQS
jgi:[acyl-carrier-protein] S-malonyltransferase